MKSILLNEQFTDAPRIAIVRSKRTKRYGIRIWTDNWQQWYAGGKSKPRSWKRLSTAKEHLSHLGDWPMIGKHQYKAWVNDRFVVA